MSDGTVAPLNVLVMGMHRSGTSAIAGALRQAGLAGGDDGDLMVVQPENPAGFGERRDVMDFDDRLLKSLGWTWDAPESVPLRTPPPLHGLVFEGRRLVEANLAGAGPWVLKDPRFSLLLPWWRQILQDRFVAVVAVRPAREVAWSLASRDGFPVDLGLALWAAYLRHLAFGLAGLPVVVVSYVALTEDPGRVMGNVIDSLERLGVSGPLDREAAASSIQPALRRATHPLTSADQGSMVKALKRMEQAWTFAPAIAFDRFKLDVDEAEPWERSLLHLQRAVRSNEERAAVAEHRADAAEVALHAARADADAARAEADAAITEAEAAQDQAEALRARLPSTMAKRTLVRLVGPTMRHLKYGRHINPLFDSNWYRSTYRDVRMSRVDAYQHYRTHGSREGRDPNPFFDTDWYLENNADVRESGQDPLDHYLAVGVAEGLDPSLRFDTDWYLEQNPGVRASGMNPLLHYLRHGARDGRPPHPMFDGRHTVSPGIVRDERRRRRFLGSAKRTLRRRFGARAGSVPDHATVVARVYGAVRAQLPTDARVAVISDGDPDLEAIPGVISFPFPDRSDGLHVARSFTSSTSAIAHLEAVRANGAGYLVIPAFSWALELPRFRHYLVSRYGLVSNRADSCRIYDISLPFASQDTSVAAQLRRSIDEFRDRFARHPAILDWDTGCGVAGIAADCQVFAPPRLMAGGLPYPDASIDIVAVDASDATAVAEANRVARAAVLSVSGRGPETTMLVAWRPGVDAIRSPSVSIVIPTYNRLGLMETCLRALQETLPTHIDTEVVIVDDGSTEGSAGLARLVQSDPRAVLIRNEVNAGFVTSVNRGARAATGDVLVFLNNDTIPLAGWLPPLLWALRDRPDAGVVGGKLVYPDGRLQEAGGIIFSDGSAANFGSGDPDPDAPEYSYVREVDYVSGALFATRRALFKDLGGFDSIYGFGYYEDSDYCFKVRAAGLRAYYQPESAIVHFEGGTSGTDVTQGPKRFQVVNRDTFVTRWRSELERHPSPPGQESSRAT